MTTSTRSHGRVQISGTYLNLNIEMGNELAPWVLLSNSLATNLHIFDAQAAALSGLFNVIRYDQRGHGESDVSENLSFEILANDVVSLLDHVGAESCVFVGLSMGVPTGLAAYSQAAARFNALIFLDGQPASMPEGAMQWQGRIDTAQSEGMDKIARSTASRWLVSGDERKSANLEQMIAATPVEGFAAAASCLKSYDFSDVVPSITVPVLTMAGENDGAMPEKMKNLATRVSNGRFVAIPDAGHVPCFEQPTLVNEALLKFLGEI